VKISRHSIYCTFSDLRIFAGTPYVALYCGQWFRVLLESLLSETKAMVFFVDIGDRQTLNLSDLREIDDRFA
jgi:Tudor domain